MAGLGMHDQDIQPQGQVSHGFAVEHTLGAGASSRIQVRLDGTPLAGGIGGVCARKPFRNYQLTISIGSVHHTVRERYSLLKDGLAGLETHSASFPSDPLSFLSDYVRNEANVQQRGEDIRRYLEELLISDTEGSIISRPQLHAALHIGHGTPMSTTLLAVAAERRRIADAKRAERQRIADAARAAEEARRAAIVRQQREDAHLAQTFNSQPAHSGALPMLTFPRSQIFELRNKIWGWGDASIKGPGGIPWFRMVRSNPSIFGEMLRNAHFTITTMAGEPLLALQENFQWMNYEYDLFRIDPHTRTLVPLCKIVRQWTFLQITDQYVIQHFNHTLAGAIECSGSWPSQFSLRVGGVPAASVNKQFFSFGDTYHVEVAPNLDIVLFIGIACAIDRIHHEVEDRRRR